MILVFAYHTIGVLPPPTHWIARSIHSVAAVGYCGVDLFFVLSGFLITRILLVSRDASNFYSAFYIRRVLRIFPLYYAAIAFTFFILPLLERIHPFWGMGLGFVPWRDQIWFWLNLSNIPTAFRPMLVPPLAHFWTLAIEEQFYFVWPTVVRHCSYNALRWIFFAGFLLPPVLRETHCILPLSPNFYERITIFHMEGLFLGAGLALLEISKLSQARIRGGAVLSFALGLGLVVIGLRSQIDLWHQALPTAFSLLFTGLIGICLFSTWPFAKFFAWSPLRSIGRYSYFIYVFHLAGIYFGGILFRHVLHLNSYSQAAVTAPVIFLTMYGLGAASWRWIEYPLLELKRFYPYRVRPKPSLELTSA